jgi:hypothetical protein
LEQYTFTDDRKASGTHFLALFPFASSSSSSVLRVLVCNSGRVF